MGKRMNLITWMVLAGVWVIMPGVATQVTGTSFVSAGIGFGLGLVSSTEETTVEMRKGPYLIYPGDNTQMTVLWQLNNTRTCALEWGLDTSYSVGSVFSDEYGSDHQHKYTITNLTPGTMYYYRVTVDGDDHTGSFLTAPAADATDVKLLAYGDTRTNPDMHDTVCAGIVSAFTGDGDFQTFLLHAGDWVGDGDVESDWTEQFFGRTWSNTMEMQANLPIQGCMGNHERSAILYRKYWPYPYVDALYWSFDYGPVHVAVIVQYVDYSPGSAQLTWLENDLQMSTKKWKFILLHEPGWTASSRINPEVQAYIQPLCLTYGVDIVFAGHEHFYASARVEGVEHLTTGGGGAPLNQPNPDYPYVAAAARALHFCRIDIQGDELYFEAVGPDGTIIDEFTLVSPLEVHTQVTPQALNPDSRNKWVKAHFVLPEGFSVDDVDVNTPVKIWPLDIVSRYIDVSTNEAGLVKIESGFDRRRFCRAVTDDSVTDIRAVGWLTSGQYFYGTSTVRIIPNNLKYLASLTSYWLETECGNPDWCGGVDVDQDSTVDFADFALFDNCCIEVLR
jgi:predicted phosphodiesterase